jgi:hypothetical protein
VAGNGESRRLTSEELNDMLTEARIENEMLMEEKKIRARDDE